MLKLNGLRFGHSTLRLSQDFSEIGQSLEEGVLLLSDKTMVLKKLLYYNGLEIFCRNRAY
jgi:hypothetical protein